MGPLLHTPGGTLAATPVHFYSALDTETYYLLYGLHGSLVGHWTYPGFVES